MNEWMRSFKLCCYIPMDWGGGGGESGFSTILVTNKVSILAILLITLHSCLELGIFLEVFLFHN